MKNNILCLILARKNSKRLPNKNKLLLGGKPLIQWTFDIAKKIFNTNNILLSTDDEYLVEIAKDNKILAPWLRPSYLAEDNSSSEDSALHAIDWYERNYSFTDGILLLQPTSPFRNIETIKKGINIFLTNQNKTVIGVSRCKQHPKLCMVENCNQLYPYDKDKEVEKSSTNLNTVFHINGSFYLTTLDSLRSNRTFTPNGSIPLICDNFYEAIDIDTEDDYLLAKLIEKSKNAF